MNRKYIILTVFISLIFLNPTLGQNSESRNTFAEKVIVPAYTAYIHPDERGVRVSEQHGVRNWKSENEEVRFYFFINTPGNLGVSLNLKSNGCRLKITVLDTSFTIDIPSQPGMPTVRVCNVTIPETGFQTIAIKGIAKSGEVFADISSLELNGVAVKAIHFNSKPRRNSASVHLSYPLPKDVKAEWFYNEILVPDGMDPVNTYYMACGFGRGYFGIQVNSATERRVIFSIWDSGNESEDRAKVPDSLKVHLTGKGSDVVSGDFGNEGTGGHSHWIYNWQTNHTYQFLVHAQPSGSCTTFSGYFKEKGQSEWKLISGWKAPGAGHYLDGLYSFVENFWGTNGDLQRKTYFANQWIVTNKGEWIELTKAKFSYDATGHAHDRIDYSAGIEGNNFYLSNGGFIKSNINYGDMIDRSASGKRPDITLPVNTISGN